MRRSALLELRNARWVKVAGDPLELEIRPSGVNTMTILQLAITKDIDVAEHICTDVLIGFRGFTENDGTPVENTLEARMELWNSTAARATIVEAIRVAQESTLEGEAGAASD